MHNQFQSRETRYGILSVDQILVNRFFTIGYSYYFRQAKWALEIVDPDKKDMDTVERRNKFRPDFRIPKRFRADLSDYSGSGYDRGHLVASSNQNDDNGVKIPVPSHFYKSILTEDINGKLKMWSCEIPNTTLNDPLENYLTTTHT